MPHFGVVGDLVYFGYVSYTQAVLCTLNLTTFHFSPFIAGGAIPCIPGNQPVATDGAFHNGYYYLVSPFSLSDVYRVRLDSSSPAWETIGVTGNAPLEYSGNTFVYNDAIWVLPILEPAIYSLSLTTFEWKKHKTQNPPKLANRDCYLPRLFENQLVLLRKIDFSELWTLDLTTMQWARPASFGLRPGRFPTNPSYVIHESRLYCLGGQQAGPSGSKSNHLRRLTLRKAPRVTPEDRLRGRFAQMFQDEFCDVVFTFPGDSRVLRAHRSVICQNEVFRAMLAGRFVETSQKLVMVGPLQFYGCKVEVKEASYVTMEALLRHLYECLDLSATEADLLDLFQLADMYLLEGLKEAIVGFVQEERDAEAALQLALAMHEEQGSRLKRKAEATIRRDFSKVCRTEQWADFLKANSSFKVAVVNK